MPPKKKAAPKRKPAASKGKAKGSKKAPAPKKSSGTKRATPAAFKVKFKPDAVLAAIIGTKPDTRGQIVARIWDYIKKNKLQDPSDGRVIVADAKLKPFFDGASKVSMLKLGGFISKHISEA